VGEQVLDGDGVVDQRQVIAQHRSCGGRAAQPSFVDQAHHGQGGQALGPAPDPNRVSTWFGISQPRCARP
jgi:hypothetical protein